MKFLHTNNQSGFTIVELLIVVVVIAILAAITIVSYNGITARSNDAARLTEAKQFGKKIESKKVLTGLYTDGPTEPASRDAFLGLYGVQSLSTRLNIVNYDGYGGDPSTPNKTKVYTYLREGGSTPHIWVSYWSNAQNTWVTNFYYDNGTTEQTLDSIPPYPG